uniref:Uncharacterized protein n=1 Tax=Rhizophora mucronata TaxID=61149 RepID=A0A2P2PGH1_RHIMU
MFCLQTSSFMSDKLFTFSHILRVHSLNHLHFPVCYPSIHMQKPKQKPNCLCKSLEAVNTVWHCPKVYKVRTPPST